ncbi:lipase [Nocardiopsis gilva YIM 90087]|uniref:Lipase n=1 Tax=Nocardiopsis gilva YIM 90087 TaxID=1235441 RepID=A0A223SCQ3_9ACTN|nr:SGNH/GDSL hydrolase family protein [Nocardiopsis gilva]ASU85927.1 lipase [Nocardiopsis gilva YIM 90087]
MATESVTSARRGRVLLAAVALCAAGGLATPPSVAAAPVGGYVALGDSYASGVGAGSYDSRSGDCQRSTRAYPQLWADTYAPSSFDFTACAGATTSDVTDSQVGPLGRGTELVSITAGANDAGMSEVLVTCVLQTESACRDRAAEARAYINETLPGRLDDVYTAIRGEARSASVVVLGYPRIYELGGTCPAGGLSEESRAEVNSALDELNDVTGKRAADHGFSFGDVRSAFTGHEICSDDPWIHGMTIPVGDSYHPTAEGHSDGYLPVLDDIA